MWRLLAIQTGIKEAFNKIGVSQFDKTATILIEFLETMIAVYQ